jgi:hypothetical protein
MNRSMHHAHVRDRDRGPESVSGLVAAEHVHPAPSPPEVARPSHSASKATYAFEPTAEGARASRKSTRKEANRSKADTNLNLREQLQKGSPEALSRKAIVRSLRVRGSR